MDWTGAKRKPQLPSSCPEGFEGESRYVSRDAFNTMLNGNKPKPRFSRRSKRKTRKQSKKPRRRTVQAGKLKIKYVGGPPEKSRLRFITGPLASGTPPWPGVFEW